MRNVCTEWPLLGLWTKPQVLPSVVTADEVARRRRILESGIKKFHQDERHATRDQKQQCCGSIGEWIIKRPWAGQKWLRKLSAFLRPETAISGALIVLTSATRHRKRFRSEFTCHDVGMRWLLNDRVNSKMTTYKCSKERARSAHKYRPVIMPEEAVEET